MPSAIEILIDKHLSPKAQSRLFAATAKKVIAKMQAENDLAAGRKGPPPRITVDGRKDAPLDSVKPDGEIVVQFNTGTDLVTWILFELKKHSPVKTGRYEKSHLAFVDGKPYAAGDNLLDAREVVIVNPQPYARKVEKGQGTAPDDGVYQAVAVIADRRYTKIADVYFDFRPVRDGNLEAYVGSRTRLAGAMRGGRVGEREAQALVARQQKKQRDRRVPAIVVRLKH